MRPTISSHIGVRRLLASFSLALMTACGGGADAPGPGPGTDTPPPSAGGSDTGFYLAAIGARPSGTPGQILLIDPEHPAPPIELALVTGPSNLYAPRAQTLTASGGRKVGMAPMAYYVANGEVFEVGLRKDEPVMASRLTNTADACYITRGAPSRLDATESWMEVSSAGPDGDCGSLSDNVSLYIRSGMSPNEAAMRLPAGVTVPTGTFGLVDAGGRALGLPVLDAREPVSRLVVYSPLMEPLFDVAGSEGTQQMVFMNGDGADAQAYYVAIDGAVRRLSWTSSSASLSPILHTLGNSGQTLYAATDASGTYFNDGTTLMRLNGEASASVVAELDASDGRINGLHLTGGHLIANQANTSSAVLSAVPKDGGAPVVLKRMDRLGDTRTLGTRGDVVYYLQPLSSTRQKILMQPASGGMETVIADNVQYVANVWNREAPRGALLDPVAVVTTTSLEGILYCVPAAGDPDCRQGEIVHHVTSSGLNDIAGRLNLALTSSSYFGLTADNFNLYVELPGTVMQFVIGVGIDGDGVSVSGAWTDEYVFWDQSSPAFKRATAHAP